MREIKFRAFIKEYDIVVDVMSIGFREKLIAISDEDGVKISNDVSCFQTEFVLDDVILLQYTGLKDKNGVEIYEGDIVNIFGFDKSLEVVFGKGSFGYFGMIHKNFISFSENYNFNFFDNKSDEIEVIGNIYENKELLDER